LARACERDWHRLRLWPEHINLVFIYQTTTEDLEQTHWDLMADADAKKDEGPLGALNGLWGGITQAAEDAKKATESGFKQIPGLPSNERTKEQIADVFKEFDKDKNNIIDPKELQDFAYSLGETWSEETCKKVFEKLDADKSGGLSLDEFSAWFLTPGAVSEVSQDDVFTKMTLGPQLFARHAQRKASEAVTAGTSGNPVEGLWGGVVKAAEDAKAMAEKAAEDAKKAAEGAASAATGGGGTPAAEASPSK
jgi:hypothetical protein